MRRTVATALAIVFLFTLVTTAAAQMGPAIVFNATLSGDQVVPDAIDTEASGVAVAVLDGNLLVVGGTYQGLSSDVAAEIAGGLHIHLAARGENGGVVVPVGNAGGTEGSFSLAIMLDDEQVEQLKAGLFYLNLHTLNNQPGEIRGQLDMQ